MAAVCAAAFCFKAQAATYFDFTTDTNAINQSGANSWIFYLGQPSAVSGNALFFKTKLTATSTYACYPGSNNSEIYLSAWHNSNYTGRDYTHDYAFSYGYNSTSGVISGSNGYGASSTLDSSDYYAMDLSCNGYRSSDLGSYLSLLGGGGTFTYPSPIFGSAAADFSGLPYFCLGDSSGDCPDGASSAITLYAPGITTPDFENWVVSESAAPSSTTFLQVLYGNSPSSFSYTDRVSFSPFVSANPTPVSKSQPLWFPPLAVPSTWYAKAQALDASGSVLASTPVQTFYIDPSSAAPASSTLEMLSKFHSLAGGETSSTISTTVNCQISSSSFLADPVGNIQNGICNALSFLFLPNSAQQSDITTRFSGLGGQIKNKPPFGYFNGVYGSLTGFDNNGTSTLIDASTTTAFGGFFGPIDDGITALLWFLFALWVVRTFRQLNT